MSWYSVGCSTLMAGDCPTFIPLPKIFPGSETYLEDHGPLPNHVHKSGGKGGDQFQVRPSEHSLAPPTAGAPKALAPALTQRSHNCLPAIVMTTATMMTTVLMMSLLVVAGWHVDGRQAWQPGGGGNARDVGDSAGHNHGVSGQGLDACLQGLLRECPDRPTRALGVAIHCGLGLSVAWVAARTR